MSNDDLNIAYKTMKILIKDWHHAKSETLAAGQRVPLLDFQAKSKEVISALRTLAKDNMSTDEYELYDSEAEKICKNLESDYILYDPITERGKLEGNDDDWKEWFNPLDLNNKPYWDEHMLYVQRKFSTGFNETEHEKDVDEVIRSLGNPNNYESWSRRGLVYAAPQSGKTLHYTGVIGRASDVGYKLIIVITSNSNILRDQTQKRLEDVYNIDKHKKLQFITDKDKDITEESSRRALQDGFEDPVHDLYNPYILVLKKNPSSLQRMIKFLNVNPKFKNLPTVIIDDESDNASINTKENTVAPSKAELKRIEKAIEEEIKKEKDRRRSEKIINLEKEGGTPDEIEAIKNEAEILSEEDIENIRVTQRALLERDVYITKINKLIRTLLNNLHRNSYVAYSATPFANVFINHNTKTKEKEGDDIFPKDFLVFLSESSEYFGIKKMFATSKLQQDFSHTHIKGYPQGFTYIQNTIGRYSHQEAELDRITDDEHATLSHNTEKITADDLKIWVDNPEVWYKPVGLPLSLQKAIRYFILAIIVRYKRSNEINHNTMLISSPKIESIEEGKRLVQIEIGKIRKSIQTYSKLDVDKALTDPVIKSLYEVWKNDTNLRWDFEAKIKSNGVKKVWQDEIMNLLSMVTNIEVCSVNSVSNESPDYEKEKINIIAVGGLAFGRGYTLEGLMVAYVLRRISDMDTLIQAARWFGYRGRDEKDYSDLVRVWMTEDMETKFFKSATTVLELEKEFREMQRQKKTPSDYALRVRTHPNINVTAKRKIGYGMVKREGLSYSNRTKYIAKFDTKLEVIKNNNKSISNLYEFIIEKNIDQLDPSGKEAEKLNMINGRYVYRDVPKEGVDEFFSKYKKYEESDDDFLDYMDKCLLDGDTNLDKWDVIFRGIDPSSWRGKESLKKQNYVTYGENKKGFKLLPITRSGGFQYNKDFNLLENSHSQIFDINDDTLLKIDKDDKRESPALFVGFIDIEKDKDNDKLKDWDIDELIPVFQVQFPPSDVVVNDPRRYIYTRPPKYYEEMDTE